MFIGIGTQCAAALAAGWASESRQLSRQQFAYGDVFLNNISVRLASNPCALWHAQPLACPDSSLDRFVVSTGLGTQRLAPPPSPPHTARSALPPSSLGKVFGARAHRVCRYCVLRLPGVY